MTLRDEIINILMTDNDWPWTPATADKILALIEGERCEWTTDCDGVTHTDCGAIHGYSCYDYIIEHVISYDPYCPCCGKKIEVKEEYVD